MQVETISVDREKARELYRDYKKHVHWSEPIDDEIRRAYRLIAQGRVIIKALESIKNAGVNEEGYPKLAICRADVEGARVDIHQNGAATMTDDERISWGRPRNASPQRWFDWPAGSFQVTRRTTTRALARIPVIPIHLRPRRGLQNYHVLWEAEWHPVPPRDPYLLRRIGIGDMWMVVAAWDLTEVERAAMAARITVQ